MVVVKMPNRGRKNKNDTQKIMQTTDKVDTPKKSFLSELESVSKSNNQSLNSSDADFSVSKHIKKRNVFSKQEEPMLPIDDINNYDDGFSDEVWTKLMNKIESESPIDDITRDGMRSYKNKNNGDKYDKMFSKELSMLSEVLSSLNSASKIVDKKISYYKDKGKSSAGGTMKSFSDIITAQNSLQQTKMQAIKSMADIKKSAEDLRMKNDKINPVIEENNDTVADNFYKSIINGGRDNFIKNAMSNISPVNNTSPDDVPDKQTDTQPFNITQPTTYIQSNDNNTIAYDISDEDEFGYIRHEQDGVRVCIEKLPDGGMVFVALDSNNEPVDDYELPSPALLDNITIPPMSSFGYDNFGRKYKIIDIGSSVDISDIMDDDTIDDD